MDSGRMREIRENLSTLPVLEERAERLARQIEKAQDEEKRLKKRYESESRDVEKLMKDSFTVMLLQHIGRYEGKLSKESEEKLQAKLQYDKGHNNLDRLLSEADALNDRIALLKRDSQSFKEELLRRKEQVGSYLSGEALDRYETVEDEIKMLSRQLAETDEARGAAGKVLDSARSAAESLGEAEGWATYDVFTRGGIFSHCAKYDCIDEAKSYMEKLEMQLQDLNRELRDIHLSFDSTQFEIDGTTRAVDFWFDNIFTDMNVRSVISGNREDLVRLCEQLNGLINTLEKAQAESLQRLAQLEQAQEEILVG